MSEDTSPESENTLNHLKDEKSPYLLQHRDNPVDWYPWGEEAFQKAKDENKPIFLSIGYSTCHWCHVMSRESFQDPEIGQLINQVFVPVKVDREERPDIDSIYMTVCQMITGSGGWPLTIIMTPDLKPFFAGTYFPKDTGPRGTGLRDLILNVHELWENQEGELLKSADELTVSLEKISQGKPGDSLPPEIITQTYHSLQENFDQQYAGFGTNQKFPTPHHLLFLLRYWKQTGETEALNMIQETLKAMRKGGIYDHIGFGFHRYTVDQQWIIPHFEKMLYDQALLAMAYTEAYQATGETEYRETAEEVLEYILRDMRSPEGGFYSAEDADSEGEEGKFYLWTAEEIQDLLGPEDGALFQTVYSISPEGNFKDEARGIKTGKNILHRTKTWDEISAELEIPSDQLWWKMEHAREVLFPAREARIHPGKDDKILTDWNGLVITALSLAGRVFGREDYLVAAGEAVDFIMTHLHSQGRLQHRWREGESAIEGNLDDYAYLIWGLLELYQATFQAEYLKAALKLNQALTKHFWDNEEGGYYFTPDHAPQILVRQKEAYDTALPSGNSVQQMNLERLYLLTGENNFRETSESLEKYFSPTMKQTPAAFTMFLSAIMFQTSPSFEVTILGEKDSLDTQGMLKALQKEYLPQVVLVLKSSSDDLIKELIPSLENKTMVGNQATAYVCGDGTCQAPVNTPEELINLLK
ncbi:thioredoxin domain-containing protein [Methanobacterium formicicum]|uniref:thioredoxin domain-containing protein n=1 Tax=Methanobacterium formicicum TaxID=2162 RepID=UPI00241271CC|nr:thioredoxin domain-containing protein [Methanobacterium formicicum]MDG3547157.1 thioredoxin domain-containing protein [Methanobacterium formicicum]